MTRTRFTRPVEDTNRRQRHGQVRTIGVDLRGATELEEKVAAGWRRHFLVLV